MKGDNKKGIIAKALEGNFLLEVFKILKSGDFVDVKFHPEEGDVQLGILSDYEKALLTYMTKISDEAEKILKSLENYQGDSWRLKARIKEIETKMETVILVKSILWNSFRTRTGFWEKGTKIILRSGFRIFKMAENGGAECDCAKCQIEKALSGGSFAIIEIVGSEGERSEEMAHISSETPSKYKH
ncbi:MAG TPA: hypothetical protein P5548_02485 [Candidatus Moranbacteria bacterium]|nr:hypothetical protein [Candidatus Moranbacteria bacterium]HRZ33735.1 hypothetical protein [Candidatus Moranbacteria bacterium]